MKKFVIIMSFAMVIMYFVGSQALAAEKELKVGVVFAATGFAAEWGVPSIRTIDVGFEKINNEGGIKVGGDVYKVKISVKDCQEDTQKTSAAVNQLVFDEGVKFIMGPLFCGPVNAEQSIGNPNKIWHMFTCFDPKALGADKPYSFRGVASGVEIGRACFDFIKKYHPQAKTIGIVTNADERLSGENTKEQAEKAGFKVTSLEFVKLGTADMFPMLTKVVNVNPDVLIPIGMPPGEVTTMLQQKHQLGYKGLVISTSFYDPRAMAQKAGEEAVEGFTYMGSDWEGNPLLQYWKKRLLERWNEFDPITSALCFWPDLLKQGMEKAQSADPTKVMEVMPNMKGTTITGKYSWGGEKTYGIKRQYEQEVHFSKYSNGKIVYVGWAMPMVP